MPLRRTYIVRFTLATNRYFNRGGVAPSDVLHLDRLGRCPLVRSVDIRSSDENPTKNVRDHVFLEPTRLRVAAFQTLAMDSAVNDRTRAQTQTELT